MVGLSVQGLSFKDFGEGARAETEMVRWGELRVVCDFFFFALWLCRKGKHLSLVFLGCLIISMYLTKCVSHYNIDLFVFVS